VTVQNRDFEARFSKRLREGSGEFQTDEIAPNEGSTPPYRREVLIGYFSVVEIKADASLQAMSP